MNWRAALIGLTLIAVGFSANATPSCTPTVKIKGGNYPGAEAIPTTNNLILPEGKSIEAQGEKLILHVRVVDSQCKPVPEAVVELWQMNPFGKWYLAEDEELVSPGPVFAGAGRAVTDGEGYFTFTTAFPGVTTKTTTKKATKKQPAVTTTTSTAPKLNIRIKADGFDMFNTVLYFDGDRRNAADPAFKKQSIEGRGTVTLKMDQLEDGSLLGTKDIVLYGNTPYRTY